MRGFDEFAHLEDDGHQRQEHDKGLLIGKRRQQVPTAEPFGHLRRHREVAINDPLWQDLLMQKGEGANGQQEQKQVLFAFLVLDSEFYDLDGLDHFGVVEDDDFAVEGFGVFFEQGGVGFCYLVVVGFYYLCADGLERAGGEEGAGERGEVGEGFAEHLIVEDDGYMRS